MNKRSEAKEAADFLLSQKEEIPNVLAVTAKRVRFARDESDDQLPLSATFVARQHVRVLRNGLRRYSRNPISWVDLSREYASLGQLPQARRAMTIGLSLAPENRFVLRSASRLFLHLDDPDRAHEILIRAKSSPFDPWLMAAEIAIAPLADRTPEFIYEGRRALSGNFEKLQLAELASALGTLELSTGNARAARKLFKQALLAPTENAVAQVSWAAAQLSDFEVNPTAFSVPRSFEARALNFYHTDRFRQALQESWNWLNDQPFSSRPAVHGSFVASALLEDYEEAIKIGDAGLIANPRDFTLLNNTAVALAKNGNIEAANKYFGRIDSSSLSIVNSVVWNATAGLLKFRANRPDEGRKLYLSAITDASADDLAVLKTRAALFWASEELRLETPLWQEAMIAAVALMKTAGDPIAKVLFNRLLEAKKHVRPPQKSKK